MRGALSGDSTIADRSRGLAGCGEARPLTTIVAVYLFGLALGGMAVGSVVAGVFPDGAPLWVAIPAALVLPFLAPLVFGLIVRRRAALAHGMEEPSRGRVVALRVVTNAAMFLMATYMLTFVYNRLDNLQNEAVSLWLSPVVVALVAFLIAAFYLPARIHSFFQAPDDRWNTISFWLTCAGAALFAVFGISLPL